MTNLIDAEAHAIRQALKSYSSIQAAYIYGSYLHSSKPGDLDLYIILTGTNNILETCDGVGRALRSNLLDIKLDINTCVDSASELIRLELLPYHMYVARTGVLAYGDDILSSFCVTELPLHVVRHRVASMANRIRHIFFNSLEDRHNKWGKWLIYAMADAELACTGTVDADLRITARRFYDRYCEQLAFLAPVFTDQPLVFDWYVQAYHALYFHLKVLDDE